MRIYQIVSLCTDNLAKDVNMLEKRLKSSCKCFQQTLPPASKPGSKLSALLLSLFWQKPFKASTFLTLESLSNREGRDEASAKTSIDGEAPSSKLLFYRVLGIPSESCECWRGFLLENPSDHRGEVPLWRFSPEWAKPPILHCFSKLGRGALDGFARCKVFGCANLLLKQPGKRIQLWSSMLQVVHIFN